MKRLIILALFCAVAFSQTAGAFLEFGLNPTGGNSDIRVAAGLTGIDLIGGGSGGGLLFCDMREGGSLLGGYTEKSQSAALWKDWGVRAAYQKGVCYLTQSERGGLLTGATLSTFWRWLRIDVNYTMATYVRESVLRTTSNWYIGASVGLFF